MIVKELKEQLENVDDNAIIFLSLDLNGDYYDEISGCECLKRKNGKIGFAELTDELKESGYTTKDIIKDGKECIVLYAPSVG